MQLLRFAEVAEGDIRLTEAGQRFVQRRSRRRKKLFAQHVSTYVPLAAHIRRVLDERRAHTRPGEPLPRRAGGPHVGGVAEQTLRAVTSWARYGEVFAYDEATGVFSLDNPS